MGEVMRLTSTVEGRSGCLIGKTWLLKVSPPKSKVHLSREPRTQSEVPYKRFDSTVTAAEGVPGAVNWWSGVMMLLECMPPPTLSHHQQSVPVISRSADRCCQGVSNVK